MLYWIVRNQPASQVPAHGEKSLRKFNTSDMLRILSQWRRWPDKRKFLKAAHACVLDIHWLSHGRFIGKHVVISHRVLMDRDSRRLKLHHVRGCLMLMLALIAEQRPFGSVPTPLPRYSPTCSLIE
jgi:hypothetical protein